MSETRAEALIQQHLLKEGGGIIDTSWCAPVHALPRRHLIGAVACRPFGPEHLMGERTLAMAAFTDKYPDLLDGYMVYTDRRLFGRAFLARSNSFAFVHYRYGAIEAVKREKSLMTDKIKVKQGQEVRSIEHGLLNDTIFAFLEALCAIPPAEREPAEAPPLVWRSEEDPVGLQYARSTRVREDPRMLFMLDYLEKALAAGWMTAEAAADLVARLTVQHRNEAYGRGIRDGRMMSPLTRDDLSNLLVEVYGRPLAHEEHPVRKLLFDGRSKNKKLIDTVDSVSNAFDTAADVLTLNAGALAEAAVGKLFAPSSVTRFTIAVADEGSSASFRLYDRHNELYHVAPLLAEDVLHTLDGLEAALLLRRCIYGWDAPVGALLTVPSSDIIERIAALVGPFDAKVLGRRPDPKPPGSP